MTKLIDNVLDFFWHVLEYIVFLALWVLVVTTILGICIDINESARKNNQAAQVECHNAEELHQAQLEWYRSHTDNAKGDYWDSTGY